MRWLLLLALLLPGCVTTVLPGPTHCHQVTYFAPLGMYHAIAQGVDGWRCAGKQDGDEALLDNK